MVDVVRASGQPQPQPQRSGPVAPWPVRYLVVWPARAVAFVVILPFWLLYELVQLVKRGLRLLLWNWFALPVLRALRDWLLVPFGRAIAWCWRRIVLPALSWAWKIVQAVDDWLWRWVFAPVGRVLAFLFDRLVRVPLRWLNRVLLVPVWHALAVVARVCGRVVAAAAAACWRAMVRVVRAIGVALRVAVVVPVAWCWRMIITPAGRAVGAVLRVVVVVPVAWCWRTIARPVGRAVAATLFVLFVVPTRWAERAVWRPIRDAVSPGAGGSGRG